MHTVIRTYSGRGASKLMDRLMDRRAEVETIIGSVPGFVSYMILRTEDGCASVTTCRDKTGTDESIERARTWLIRNAADLKLNSPVIAEGEAVITLGR